MAKNRVVFAGLLALGLIVFSCKQTEKITTTASNEFSTTPVSITTIFPASFGIPNLPMDNQLTEEGIETLSEMVGYWNHLDESIQKITNKN